MSQHSLDDWSGGADGASTNRRSESVATSGRSDLPETCLSFEIRGPWAHFRRVEGNIVKQTYLIPPRTTVAGIVAAMLGLNRDSYYDAFGPESSRVAIEPTEELRTMNVPQNTLSTAKEHLKTIPSRGNARISLPDPTELRQQHNYELLVDPAYRIDLQLADEDLFDHLRNRLETGTSHYPPSLGLSEHLAEVKFLGSFEVQELEPETVRVDSAVVNATDDVQVESGKRIRVERSPGYMTANEGGRTTTDFLSVAYSPVGESLLVADATTAQVDDRRVMFS